MIRAFDNNYKDFKLTKYDDHFGKFNDISFRYLEHGQTYIRLFKIEHFLDESKQINVKKFKKCQEFGLTEYFKSFLNTEADNKNIKNYVLFTNIRLADEALGLFEEIQTSDDILDTLESEYKNIIKTPKKYKLALKKDHKLNQIFLDLAKENKNLIEIFCEKFILVTGQPSANEIDTILRKKIAVTCNLDNGDELYNNYLDMFRNKHYGVSLTYKDIKQFIYEQNVSI